MPLRLRNLAQLTGSADSPSKFQNVRTQVGEVTLDSRMEAKRLVELQHLQRAGEVRNLRRQVRYTLLPAVRYSPRSRQVPAVVYVADFVYEEKVPARELAARCCRGWQKGLCVHGGTCKHPPGAAEWREVIEDVKGLQTPYFKLKRHMMKAILGLDILLTRPR